MLLGQSNIWTKDCGTYGYNLLFRVESFLIKFPNVGVPNETPPSIITSPTPAPTLPPTLAPTPAPAIEEPKSIYNDDMMLEEAFISYCNCGR